MTNNRNVISEQCCHLLICSACLPHYNKNECPLCKGPFDVKKVYAVKWWMIIEDWTMWLALMRASIVFTCRRDSTVWNDWDYAACLAYCLFSFSFRSNKTSINLRRIRMRILIVSCGISTTEPYFVEVSSLILGIINKQNVISDTELVVIQRHSQNLTDYLY